MITSRLEPYDGYYCGLARWIRDESAIATYRARGGRVTTLWFEDLVTDPWGVQRKLETVLGAPADRRLHEYGRPGRQTNSTASRPATSAVSARSSPP